MVKRKSRINPHPLRPLTKEEREDQEDLELLRKDMKKGGKTYSFQQVMKEMGYHDLARPINSRR